MAMMARAAPAAVRIAWAGCGAGEAGYEACGGCDIQGAGQGEDQGQDLGCVHLDLPSFADVPGTVLRG